MTAASKLNNQSYLLGMLKSNKDVVMHGYTADEIRQLTADCEIDSTFTFKKTDNAKLDRFLEVYLSDHKSSTENLLKFTDVNTLTKHEKMLSRENSGQSAFVKNEMSSTWFLLTENSKIPFDTLIEGQVLEDLTSFDTSVEGHPKTKLQITNFLGLAEALSSDVICRVELLEDSRLAKENNNDIWYAERIKVIELISLEQLSHYFANLHPGSVHISNQKQLTAKLMLPTKIEENLQFTNCGLAPKNNYRHEVGCEFIIERCTFPIDFDFNNYRFTTLLIIDCKIPAFLKFPKNGKIVFLDCVIENNFKFPDTFDGMLFFINTSAEGDVAFPQNGKYTVITDQKDEHSKFITFEKKLV